jgi:hypothetical protein
VWALAVAVFSMWNSDPARAQGHPGLEPFSPPRILWLAMQAEASFRHDSSPDEPYTLTIIVSDPETLTVSVRYNPVLDQMGNDQSQRGMLLQASRNGMVMSVKTATASIKAIAKSAGWSWLKVNEDVKNYQQAMDAH